MTNRSEYLITMALVRFLSVSPALALFLLDESSDSSHSPGPKLYAGPCCTLDGKPDKLGTGLMHHSPNAPLPPPPSSSLLLVFSRVDNV